MSEPSLTSEVPGAWDAWNTWEPQQAEALEAARAKKLEATRQKKYKSQRGGEFLTIIDDLQKSSKYSDLTIKCGDQSFPVHRCIVFSQSPSLETSYFHRQGEIVLLDDPLVVTKMIDYLYGQDYKVDAVDISSSSSFKGLIEYHFDIYRQCDGDASIEASLGLFLFHMKMYTLAYSLGIKGLSSLAKNHLQRSLIENMTPELFPECISMMYGSVLGSDPELRDAAVQATIDHRVQLRSTQSSKQRVIEDDLLYDVPDFAHDVLVAMMDRGADYW